MAKRRYVVQLSERAQKDFKAIQRYTLKQYSKQQVLKYSKTIKSGIEKISKNPELYGHSRPDIPERYRSHQVGEYCIICRVDEKTIFIVAIFHRSLDFLTQLQ